MEVAVVVNCWMVRQRLNIKLSKFCLITYSSQEFSGLVEENYRYETRKNLFGESCDAGESLMTITGSCYDRPEADEYSCVQTNGQEVKFQDLANL